MANGSFTDPSGPAAVFGHADGPHLNEVRLAEVRVAALNEALTDPQVDESTKCRLRASAAQSRRELHALGQNEAAAKYDALVSID